MTPANIVMMAAVKPSVTLFTIASRVTAYSNRMNLKLSRDRFSGEKERP